MNVEIDIVSIKYENKRIDLIGNPYQALKDLEKYLDFITELCKGICKNNNLIKKKNLKIYYITLFYTT